MKRDDTTQDNVRPFQPNPEKAKPSKNISLTPALRACAWLYVLDDLKEDDPVAHTAVNRLKELYAQLDDQKDKVESLKSIIWHAQNKGVAEWAVTEALALAKKSPLLDGISLYVAIEHNDVIDVAMKGKVSDAIGKIFMSAEQREELVELMEEEECDILEIAFLAESFISNANILVGHDSSFAARFAIHLLRQELSEEARELVKTLLLYLITNEEDEQALIKDTSKKGLLDTILYDATSSTIDWKDLMNKVDAPQDKRVVSFPKKPEATN